MKIYREGTNDPFNFLTIDSTLPASDPLRLKKNCLSLMYVFKTLTTKAMYKNDNK